MDNAGLLVAAGSSGLGGVGHHGHGVASFGISDSLGQSGVGHITHHGDNILLIIGLGVAGIGISILCQSRFQLRKVGNFYRRSPFLCRKRRGREQSNNQTQ